MRSTTRGVFFNPGPASASVANTTALRTTFHLLDLFSTAPNRRAADTGNFPEAFQTASTPLPGQQANKVAATLLIQSRQYAVDGAMVFGHAASRMNTTDGADTPAHRKLL
jgi:hypothetical protein